MPQTTYLFYDTETTGLDPVFDQILQFAAIRTDLDLNPIGEPVNIGVRLRPDVIPSPGAFLSHRTPISQALVGTLEYEAIRHIHHLVNQPGTTSIGYNSLSFDDKFLRFSFYRNLLPPYDHQFRKGCGRMDLFPFTVAYRLFQPDVLDEWPTIDGLPTFKLEYLKSANNLAAGVAHDALVDVQSTIELARRFFQHRHVWNSLAPRFTKRGDQDLFKDLPVLLALDGNRYVWATMLRLQHSPEPQLHIPVLYLGRSKAYSNQTFWLRLDDPDLSQLTRYTAVELARIYRKKDGAKHVLLRPTEQTLSTLHPNQLSILARNQEWLASSNGILQELQSHYINHRYPALDVVDVDAALYTVYEYNHPDLQTAAQYTAKSPEEKSNAVDDFTKPEFRRLAHRIICRNYPEQTPQNQQQAYLDYLRFVWSLQGHPERLDYRGKPALSVDAFTQAIQQAKTERTLDSAQLELLTELDIYVQSQRERYASAEVKEN